MCLSHWSLFRQQEGKKILNFFKTNTSGIFQGINLTTFSWGGRSGVDLGRLAEECVAEVFHFSHSLNRLFSYISQYWGCYYKVWQMSLFGETSCLVLLNLVSSSKGPALTWQNTPATQTHHPVIDILNSYQIKVN